MATGTYIYQYSYLNIFVFDSTSHYVLRMIQCNFGIVFQNTCGL